MTNIVSNWVNSESFAKKLDQNDPLKDCRDLFHLPTFTKHPVIYYTGNSLGLQPKTTKSYSFLGLYSLKSTHK